MICAEVRLSVEGDNPPVVRAAGALTYENCDSLGDLIKGAFTGATVELDLGDLDFVDSSGLRILVTAARDARRAGRLVRIVALRRQLSHVLDVSQFRSLFEITAQPAEYTAKESLLAPEESPDFQALPTFDACHDARQTVRHYAASMGFNSEALDDICLAVGEAVSNAVRHGSCADGEPIDISCRRADRRLRVTLSYPSSVFDPQSVPEPELDAFPRGGMGIYFMKLVMDKVEYTFADGRALLTLEKLLD